MIWYNAEFRDAITAALGSAPDLLTPGKISRLGKNRSLWAILSFDRSRCSFGDQRTGYKKTVFAAVGRTGTAVRSI